MTFFSTLILLTSFIICATKRPASYIFVFAIQSFILAVSAVFTAFNKEHSDGFWDLILLAVVILVLKVIYIPRILNNTLKKVLYKVEKDFFLNIPTLVLISFGLTMFSYFVTSPFKTGALSLQNQSLANSIAVSLIGLFFMITRKKAIGQISGFLIIENGLFSAAMFATGGMPLIVDLGIFIDLITAILIMGLLVFRINDKFDSIDINKLRRLKG